MSVKAHWESYEMDPIEPLKVGAKFETGAIVKCFKFAEKPVPGQFFCLGTAARIWARRQLRGMGVGGLAGQRVKGSGMLLRQRGVW